MQFAHATFFSCVYTYGQRNIQHIKLTDKRKIQNLRLKGSYLKNTYYVYGKEKTPKYVMLHLTIAIFTK